MESASIENPPEIMNTLYVKVTTDAVADELTRHSARVRKPPLHLKDYYCS